MIWLSFTEKDQSIQMQTLSPGSHAKLNSVIVTGLVVISLVFLAADVNIVWHTFPVEKVEEDIDDMVPLTVCQVTCRPSLNQGSKTNIGQITPLTDSDKWSAHKVRRLLEAGQTSLPTEPPNTPVDNDEGFALEVRRLLDDGENPDTKEATILISTLLPYQTQILETPCSENIPTNN